MGGGTEGIIMINSYLAYLQEMYSLNQLNIYPKRNYPEEKLLVDLIKSIITKYNLKFHTNTIVADRTAISHSHPKLTIGTKYMRNVDLTKSENKYRLLSLLIHENLHYDKKLTKCNSLLSKQFPKASKLRGGVLHLAVIYNEYMTMKKLVPPNILKELFKPMNNPYPEIVRKLFVNFYKIEDILKKGNCIVKY